MVTHDVAKMLSVSQLSQSLIHVC